MYDFIVVGSGSAGGVLSRKLNASGAKTVLLEAGKFYRKDTFPNTEMETSAQLYWGPEGFFTPGMWIGVCWWNGVR